MTMIRTLVVVLFLVLGSGVRAQTYTHNLTFSPGAMVSPTFWNGSPAVLIVNAGADVCAFLPPNMSVYGWHLDVVAVGLVDLRPCAAGIAKADLSYFDYHWPDLGISLPASGVYVGLPQVTGTRLQWQAAQPFPTRWSWSYCNMVQCTVARSCGTMPQWNVVVAIPSLL